MLERKSIVSIEDVSTEEMFEIFRVTDEMQGSIDKKKRLTSMSGRIMSTLFYEPSTRTRMSFEAAMHRLGGSVISMAEPKASSAAKGETLADSIRMFSSYSDIIVIRHPLDGAARLAAKFSSVPVINGGDGSGQHPTQTLLDLYTIYHSFSSIDGLKIAILGDLKYGRTVHSLVMALSRFDVEISLVSPPILRIPDYIKSRVQDNVKLREETDLNEVLSNCDVLYVTRIQKERFSDMNEYNSVIGTYSIDVSDVDKMKKNAMILHPLPRVDEIKPTVDYDPRSAYFKQAANGVPVRMALISLILGD
ncbi:MAG: aspartate carbamoyltransferase [Candidatus Thermoplasmatota archaeon]|nr:aspartate carbamoyltransferase [Candidatus Thermoplasmatota archaeon]MCL5665527.1 aspartate carbamoyltransferase [Candidatus Thermoplasmatota archaeon]